MVQGGEGRGRFNERNDDVLKGRDDREEDDNEDDATEVEEVEELKGTDGMPLRGKIRVLVIGVLLTVVNELLVLLEILLIVLLLVRGLELVLDLTGPNESWPSVSVFIVFIVLMLLLLLLYIG